MIPHPGTFLSRRTLHRSVYPVLVDRRELLVGEVGKPCRRQVVLMSSAVRNAESAACESAGTEPLQLLVGEQASSDRRVRNHAGAVLRGGLEVTVEFDRPIEDGALGLQHRERCAEAIGDNGLIVRPIARIRPKAFSAAA